MFTLDYVEYDSPVVRRVAFDNFPVYRIFRFANWSRHVSTPQLSKFDADLITDMIKFNVSMWLVK